MAVLKQQLNKTSRPSRLLFLSLKEVLKRPRNQNVFETQKQKKGRKQNKYH